MAESFEKGAGFKRRHVYQNGGDTQKDHEITCLNSRKPPQGGGGW